MKNKTSLRLLILSLILIFVEFGINAQIQDIKKNAEENKSNHSNDNSSSNNSSNSNSSNNNTSNDNSSNNNSTYENPTYDNSSYGNSSYDNSTSNNSADGSTTNNNSAYYNSSESCTNGCCGSGCLSMGFDVFFMKDSSIYEKTSTSLYFMEINMDCAIGYEHSKDKNYTYVNYLPGMRLNLSCFSIDYRYNMLTEKSSDVADAFKTWDLLFLLNFRAGEKAKIIAGTGMHKELYTNMLFNTHYFQIKKMFARYRDFLDVNGRISIDYKTLEFPFSEVGIHYNKRFLRLKSLYGYFSFGAIYQNYYSSTDIWALQTGVSFNFH